MPPQAAPCSEILRSVPAAEVTRLLCGLLEHERHPNVCAAAVDVSAACTGFIYSATIADGLIATGVAERKASASR